MFPMWSVLRLYVTGSSCNYERALRRQYLFVRQSPASKDVNTEGEEATALEAVTRRQPVKIEQTGDLARAVVKCRVCELAIAL
jgi:hypothetical protein